MVTLPTSLLPSLFRGKCALALEFLLTDLPNPNPQLKTVSRLSTLRKLTTITLPSSLSQAHASRGSGRAPEPCPQSHAHATKIFEGMFPLSLTSTCVCPSHKKIGLP
mmetsp:Transcript_49786/g.125167  ORF Transcript_49786/g.125167 Transcript_49786/m.125167 type:complete len:107 (-) Transcript_49786:207-527(-)